MALLVSHKGAIALYLPHLPYIFHKIIYDLYAAVEDGRCGRCFLIFIDFPQGIAGCLP